MEGWELWAAVFVLGMLIGYSIGGYIISSIPASLKKCEQDYKQKCCMVQSRALIDHCAAWIYPCGNMTEDEFRNESVCSWLV